MVLNYDCLRDVLLVLESNLTIDDDLRFIGITLEEIFKQSKLKSYSKQDIYYSIFNLNDINFIDARIQFADGGLPYYCHINKINYDGHEFLQSIKSDTVWNKTKTKLKPLAGLSIPLIAAVAKEVIISSIGIN